MRRWDEADSGTVMLGPGDGIGWSRAWGLGSCRVRGGSLRIHEGYPVDQLLSQTNEDVLTTRVSHVKVS
jgi:hypothetical protein